MSKKLKRSLIGAGVFILLVVAAYYTLKIRTKSYSPEDTVVFQKENLELEVFYNRPYKKDREIFGSLVPHGEVWRTGANEATTFKTNLDINIDGSPLPAGEYTLWTIPMKGSWKVIFNSKMYAWGITIEKVASREPEHDVLIIERPVEILPTPVEQFTISFQEKNDMIFMILAWDTTAIEVPITKQPLKN